MLLLNFVGRIQTCSYGYKWINYLQKNNIRSAFSIFGVVRFPMLESKFIVPDAALEVPSFRWRILRNKSRPYLWWNVSSRIDPNQCFGPFWVSRTNTTLKQEVKSMIFATKFPLDAWSSRLRPCWIKWSVWLLKLRVSKLAKSNLNNSFRLLGHQDSYEKIKTNTFHCKLIRTFDVLIWHLKKWNQVPKNW